MSRHHSEADASAAEPGGGGTAHRSRKDHLIEELGEAFRIYGNAEEAFDNLAAQRLGVNRTDLACLDVVQRRGPLTAGELARETGLTTGAVTAVIDRLEASGYARRTRDSHDRRKVLVSGTKALERCFHHSSARILAQPLCSKQTHSL